MTIYFTDPPSQYNSRSLGSSWSMSKVSMRPRYCAQHPRIGKKKKKGNDDGIRDDRGKLAESISSPGRIWTFTVFTPLIPIHVRVI